MIRDNPRLRFPPGLSAAEFLQRHWQKAPLLLPAALDPGDWPLSPDELAGLALEDDVEARLIRHDGAGAWTMEDGPFDRSDFESLPAANWTLLVQDTDKHLPALSGFLAYFGLLPAWRLDDIMISVAAPGGGVGPHVDQYDVFLCQMSGHRRWRIGAPSDAVARSGSTLRQIQPFQPVAEHVLKPGDVLYLPPGVPHDGVAEDLCTTWSVGFRAPTRQELLAGLDPGHTIDDDQPARYRDPDLVMGEARDRLIGTRALARFRDLLPATFQVRDDALMAAAGRCITSTKAWLRPEPPESPLSPEILALRLAAGEDLVRHGMAVFARGAAANKRWLFASGNAYPLGKRQWAIAALLCAQRHIAGTQIPAAAAHKPAMTLLSRLYNDGQLLLSGDAHAVQCP